MVGGMLCKSDKPSIIIIIKVININSPGSNPKSNHITIHIVIDTHKHVFVILNITHHIYFVNPINVSAHSISNAGVIWITFSMHIPSLHINSVSASLTCNWVKVILLIISTVSSVRISQSEAPHPDPKAPQS